MEQLYDRLKEEKVSCKYFYQTYQDGMEPVHGYLTNLKSDEVAKRCFEAMMKFLKNE
ncbi:hypothetical protein IM774_09270 [Erysipelotrichaceae bacterium RD49]|nr:hypothetical protein [Erysipelotrichaceae bacterium RD49]